MLVNVARKNDSFTKTLPFSIESLIKGLEQSPKINPKILARLIEESHVEKKDIVPWSTFDHSVNDSYGRTMIYEGENFEMMAMSWLPWDFSAIHDHGGTRWGAVKYFGAAEHNCFKLTDTNLVCVFEETTHSNQINLVNNSLIHQMGNPFDTPFMSLHVYGKNVPELPITNNARIFELYLQEVQLTDGGVFFHLPEEYIKDKQNKVSTSDVYTAYKHDFPMLLRTCLILNFDSSLSDEKMNALSEIKQTLIGRLFEPEKQYAFFEDVRNSYLMNYQERWAIWKKYQACLK